MADKSSTRYLSFLISNSNANSEWCWRFLHSAAEPCLAAGIKPFSVCWDGRWHDYYIQLLRSNVSNVYPVAGGWADYCSALIWCWLQSPRLSPSPRARPGLTSPAPDLATRWPHHTGDISSWGLRSGHNNNVSQGLIHSRAVFIVLSITYLTYWFEFKEKSNI